VVLRRWAGGWFVGQVVDRHALDVAPALLGVLTRGAEEVASDATEAVDAYADRHSSSCCPGDALADSFGVPSWVAIQPPGGDPGLVKGSRPLFRTQRKVVTRLSPPPGGGGWPARRG